MHISVPIEDTIEFIEYTQISPLVSRCKIKVLYTNDNEPNRNGSIITKEVAEKIGQKLPGSPIVGYFNKENNDYEEHNRALEYDKEEDKFKLLDITKPYGFVPTDAKVWFQLFRDDNEINRLYLCTEGIIWTEAYPESKRILEEGNNQSMEFHKETLAGNWTEKLNSNRRFFIINEATIEKLCVLGEDFEPCFEGAQIKSEFSFSDAFEELRHNTYLMIRDMSNKGGFNSMEQNKIVTSEEVEEIVDFVKKEEEEKTSSESENSQGNADNEKDISEKPPVKEDEEKKEKYNLNEIPEYVDLMDKYTKLQSSYAELENEKNNLFAELEPLRTFKSDKEREAKQEMIKSFYMLSDEDKKDVIENIDNYTLNDIESKLSVICVRNKVNFAASEENCQTESPQLTYNLNAAVEQEDMGVPDWLKVVREIEESMN